MSKKPQRRTAQRIQEVALDLCNRLGMTNVSTTQIAAEIRISPGNLYYHYASKDDLINTLFDQHEEGVMQVLRTGGDVRDLPAAWGFCRALLEEIWRYRFIYRALNHLLVNNRHIETHIRILLARVQGELQDGVLAGLKRSRLLDASPQEREALSESMLLVLMYWLNYEYVCDPRRSLEAGNVEAAIERGTARAIGLLGPYLKKESKVWIESRWDNLPKMEAATGLHDDAVEPTDSAVKTWAAAERMTGEVGGQDAVAGRHV